MYSKYERRTDTRTYEDRKKLYEGVRIDHCPQYGHWHGELTIFYGRAGKFFILKEWKKTGKKNTKIGPNVTEVIIEVKESS